MKIIKNIRLNNGRPYHYHSPYWNEWIIEQDCDVSTVVKDAIRVTSENEGSEWSRSFFYKIECTDAINQVGDILVVPTKGHDGNVFYVETANVTKEEDGDIRKFYCEGNLIAIECEGTYHFNWDGFGDQEYKKLASHDRRIAETEAKIDAIIKDEYSKFIGNVKKRLDGVGSVTDIYISHDEYEGETYLVLKVNGEIFSINLYR